MSTVIKHNLNLPHITSFYGLIKYLQSSVSITENKTKLPQILKLTFDGFAVLTLSAGRFIIKALVLVSKLGFVTFR
jgi:hypothetical protein